MLFPKGPRFDPLKVPEVPGPNTYNVDQESHLDAYKRGAFLEKTDRFNEEKLADVPGPNTYDTEVKPRARPAAAKGAPKQLSSADRYAALQRKLEDLERLHTEGKKAHQLDLERLKLELTRARQTTTEQADRLEKLKKQNETLDTRVQDFKKSSASDAAEIKDLRVKLRMAEHERTQLSTKQGEVGDAKKALQAADARRKEEVRDKDRKIAELEKALAGERKKREGADVKLKEVKTKADEEVQKVRESSKDLQAQIDEARNEARQAQSSLAALGGETEHKEAELLAHLEQCRSVLGRVAKEYGRLASVTVSAPEHSDLKQEHAALKMRSFRLERKLANSEGQVIELANLIRQTKEQNAFLSAQLRDAEDAVKFYSRALDEVAKDAHHQIAVDIALEAEITAVGRNFLDSERRVQESRMVETGATLDFYRLACTQILSIHSEIDEALTDQQQVAQQQATDLTAAVAARDSIASQLEAVRLEQTTAQQLLVTANVAAAEAQADNAATKERMYALEAQLRDTGAKNAEALRVERQIAQRASAAAQIAKMSEEGLRAEVEQLTVELTDAERYQEAYHSLMDEVGGLMDRNNLAEDEVERLSKFNAEIVGHHNPAQRIMYLDRIRRELAEAKQKLLALTRDRDVIAATNEDLLQELGMYKSVAVTGDKQRTNITRIERPLASQNLNVNPNPNGSVVRATSRSSEGKTARTSTLESIPGDMTLDELA